MRWYAGGSNRTRGSVKTLVHDVVPSLGEVLVENVAHSTNHSSQSRHSSSPRVSCFISKVYRGLPHDFDDWRLEPTSIMLPSRTSPKNTPSWALMIIIAINSLHHHTRKTTHIQITSASVRDDSGLRYESVGTAIVNAISKHPPTPNEAVLWSRR